MSDSSCTIDVTRYLAYDNVSTFTGPWTVYFAGGSSDTGTAGSNMQLAVAQGEPDTANKTIQVRVVTVDDSGNATYTGQTITARYDFNVPET